MGNVHDVAARIARHFPTGLSTMKLQKLTYFALGWGFALLGRPIFTEKFQAWRNGPVCYELFTRHRREYMIHGWPLGDETNLEPEDKIVIDAVLKNYGALSGLQLSDLTHEPLAPWSRIRRENGVSAGEASKLEIPDAYMQEYFDELTGMASRRKAAETAVDPVNW